MNEIIKQQLLDDKANLEKSGATNELIKVVYNNDRPTVSGRELHAALEVKTEYPKWLARMCEYGFIDNVDFNSVIFDDVRLEGGREVKRQLTDHQLTIDMAKEIAMLQRTEKGKQVRQYFLEVERRFNSPEYIMKRALQIADEKVKALETTVNVQTQQIAELKPKASYYDLILNCKDLLSTTQIAKDYGKSAKWLNQFLKDKGIQFRQGKVWLLYQKYAEYGYTSTKTHVHNGSDGTQHATISTYWTQKGRLFIYGLLKNNGILPLIERED